MKRTTLLFFAILSAFAINAQTTSGTFFAGGTLAFTSSSRTVTVGPNSTDDWKSSSVIFNPNVGVFIFDQTAIGIFASFTSSTFTDYSPNGDRTITRDNPVGVGVFGRQYFMLAEPFGFTATVGVQGLFGSSETEDYDFSDNETTITRFKTSGIQAGIAAGPIWFPVPSIGLEANVGLLGFRSVTNTQENVSPEVSNKESGFLFGVSSMNLNFGFHYYF